MKFRIIEEREGNKEPKYFIDIKKWWGWSRVCEYFMSGAFEKLFSSIENAENYIKNNYPITTKVIKEVNI